MSESHCPDGGSNVPEVVSGQVLEKSAHDTKKWRCEQCTFENNPKNRYCEVCLMKNPSFKHVQKTSKSVVKEEDKQLRQPQQSSQNSIGDDVPANIEVKNEILSNSSQPELPLPDASNSVSTNDNISSEMDHKLVKNGEETTNLSEDNPATDNGSYEITCPKCTYNNPREFRFCDICGTQLQDLAAFRSARSPVKGTRRPSASRPVSEAKKQRKSATSISQLSEPPQDGDINDDRSKKRDREIVDIKTPTSKRRRSNTEGNSDVEDEIDEIPDKNISTQKTKSARKVESANRIPLSPSPRKQPQPVPSSSSQGSKRPPSSSSSSSKTSDIHTIHASLNSSKSNNGNKPSRSSHSNSSSQPSTSAKQSNSADKVARADRAAEMQAIYEQFYAQPPPLKRGMVILWNCSKCNLENAIREKNCAQCRAPQVSRFHYAALCTHYKALEGRRLKRLSDQEENGGDTLLTMATGKNKSSHLNQDASVSKNQQNHESHPTNTDQQTNKTSEKHTDNAKRVNGSAKSRRHVRSNGEPRKPRVPIILQYPPKEPKIGADYQVDIERLPDPTLFIKQKMDYSMYFDHLSEEQVPLDELSPWQYNNAYYDVLWLTTDHVQYKQQPLPLSQLTIGLERFQDMDVTHALPPPLPVALFIDDTEKKVVDAPNAIPAQPPTEQISATVTSSSSMDVDETALSVPDTTTLPVDSDPSTGLPINETTIKMEEQITAENKEGVSDSLHVAAHVVSDVVAEVEKSIDVKTSAAMTSTSFTVLTYPLHGMTNTDKISSATSVVASMDPALGEGTVNFTCEENLIRGMSAEQLTRFYPVLALQSLFQHRHILDDVYTDIKSTVLERHTYVSRPHRTDVKPAIPLEPDHIHDNEDDTMQPMAKHTQLFAQSMNASSEEGQISGDISEKPQNRTTAQRKFYVGPLDTPVLELSAKERNRFQQALIRHGNDEWNLVAKFLDYDYTVGQLQDYYYGTWTTKYRSLAQVTERMHRSYKRSLSMKRPRRVGTSRELSNLLLDQERGNFMNDFGGRVSSKKRDKRREEEGVSIVQHDRERKPTRDEEEEEEEEDYRVGDEDVVRNERKGRTDDDSNLEDQESDVPHTVTLDTVEEEDIVDYDNRVVKPPFRYLSEEMDQEEEENDLNEELVDEGDQEGGEGGDSVSESSTESDMEEDTGSCADWEEEVDGEIGDGNDGQEEFEVNDVAVLAESTVVEQNNQNQQEGDDHSMDVDDS